MAGLESKKGPARGSAGRWTAWARPPPSRGPRLSAASMLLASWFRHVRMGAWRAPAYFNCCRRSVVQTQSHQATMTLPSLPDVRFILKSVVAPDWQCQTKPVSVNSSPSMSNSTLWTEIPPGIAPTAGKGDTWHCWRNSCGPRQQISWVWIPK